MAERILEASLRQLAKTYNNPCLCMTISIPHAAGVADPAASARQAPGSDKHVHIHGQIIPSSFSKVAVGHVRMATIQTTSGGSIGHLVLMLIL
jgi:hypothetical protein